MCAIRITREQVEAAAVAHGKELKANPALRQLEKDGMRPVGGATKAPGKSKTARAATTRRRK
jgi:hypothetical protein